MRQGCVHKSLDRVLPRRRRDRSRFGPTRPALSAHWRGRVRYQAPRSQLTIGVSGQDSAGMQHRAIPCVRKVCYLRGRACQQARGACRGVAGRRRRRRRWRTRHDAPGPAIRRLGIAGHHAVCNGRSLRQPDPSFGRSTLGYSTLRNDSIGCRRGKNNRETPHAPSARSNTYPGIIARAC
jgi:hypothetical protein